MVNILWLARFRIVAMVGQHVCCCFLKLPDGHIRALLSHRPLDLARWLLYGWAQLHSSPLTSTHIEFCWPLLLCWTRFHASTSCMLRFRSTRSLPSKHSCRGIGCNGDGVYSGAASAKGGCWRQKVAPLVARPRCFFSPTLNPKP